MNTEELLEQFVTEVETMLENQKTYYKEPKESQNKYPLLIKSKAQEKKVREMVQNYRDEQRKKREPSLFPD